MQISHREIIDREAINSDDWVHLSISDPIPAAGRICVDLETWVKDKELLIHRHDPVAVRLQADQAVESLLDDLAKFSSLFLQIENPADGRSYSQAYLLRNRYNFKGEIRAIGEVYQDHLNFLERCGVSSFELAESENVSDARSGAGSYSQVFQPSADGAVPVFARRRRI
jgi:uncharacterized protein (DUF934 family)